MEEDKEKVTEGSREDSSQSESLQESGLGESVNGDKGSTPRDQDSGLEDSTDPASEKGERREGSQKGSKKRSSKREQRKSGRVTSSSIGSELEKTVAGFEDSSALETSDNSELSEKSERSRSSSRGTPSGVKRRVVRILIKGGKNLREVAGKKKINIPYIVASFNGHKKTFKSKLQNTLAPSWNEKLQFVIGEDTEENILKFQVYDEKGQTKDELLGETAIEVATLEWKKKRFDYKDHKLTHPKMEVQGKLSFILLLTERVIPEAELAALESTRKVVGEAKGADDAKKKKKDEKKLKKEEKLKQKEEKAKKKKEDKERERTLKKSRPLVGAEEGKGTLGKAGKVVPTEKHNIETKGGIAAPPDLLWQFISEFHNVEEWLPKTPAEAVPSAENGKLLRRIQYPEYESVEQLDEKNDAEMKLRFSSAGGKDWKGVAGAVGYSITLQVVPVGKSRSRLTWAVEYELPPGASEEEAKKFFETLVEAGMDGLKVAAEG